MSAIAWFILVPKGLIDELRNAAVTKVVAGKHQDDFHHFLSEKGTEIGDYAWSGYVIGTLLPYLEQKKDIDLMKPDFEGLGEFITNMRGTTSFVLTTLHREKYLEHLAPSNFEETELKTYFEEFNETEFAEAGKAMLDGIAIFRTSLERVSSESIVLVRVG